MVIGCFNRVKFKQVTTVISINMLRLYLIVASFVVMMLLKTSGDVELNPGPPCKSLSMCHVNIRSLSRSKLKAIQCNLANLYDVITLSETHLHAGVTNDVFTLNGFHDIIRKDRGAQGGGVAIYIRETLCYKRMMEYERADVEALWIQLNTIEGKVLFCSIYRPPDKTGGPPPLEFWDNLDQVLDDIKSSSIKYIYLLGDLNADFNTVNGQRLAQLCIRQNLECLIEEPTRITPTSATILDQIITNAPNFVRNTEVSAPVSTNDHCTISVKLNFKVPHEPTYSRLIWQYERADIARFRAALREADFDRAFSSENIDDVCITWTETFLNVARTFVPNKLVTIRPRDSPWYNNMLRLLKRKLTRVFKRFKANNNVLDWQKYKELRNEYQYKLDKAENEHMQKMSSSLASSRNSKSWWKTVKCLIGRGGDASYPALEVNNNIVTNNKDKAAIFNNFFLSHSTIDTTNAKLPDQPAYPIGIDQIQATESEVSDLLKCIDTTKATGPDGISPKLLYLAGDTIVPSLTRLINLSLQLALVPKSWKEANVIPLYKKGKKSDINNYRPVSLLPCLSKILEKIVFKHLFNYLRDQNLLTPHQSGFRPGDSTLNQLSYLYHVFACALDCKKSVQIVFCDISKAFDRCWHDGIIFKLKSFGIGGNLLTWFQNYLNERYQKVVIRGQSSEIGLIQAGVPQGSVLGPLLFLMYINDLPLGIQSNIKLFADDATVYIDFDDPNQAAEILNKDLMYVQSWADQWLVKFSPTKTKSMTLSFKHDAAANLPQILFNNTVLDTVKSHKHLGLTITNKLTWNLHISNVISSASSMADVLKKLKYQVDRKSLETIYFTFIRPKLEYSCHIWDNCNNKDSELLEKFQMDIARTVSGARKGTSHNAIYEELGWQKLQTRRKVVKEKQFSKLVNKTAPKYLYELLPGTVGESSQRNLRNANNIKSIKCRTETFKSSFIPSSISYWNQRKNNNYQEVENSCNNLFYFGRRETQIKHAQLRMKCSKLNAHLFNLHVTESPDCHCGFNCEDTSHYLLQCPLYINERNELLECLRNLRCYNVTDDILLRGINTFDYETNLLIFASVFSYIEKTKRL